MKIYKIGMVAKRLGVDISTLRRWDRLGKFKAHRYPSGTRFYTEEQIQELLKND